MSTLSIMNIVIFQGKKKIHHAIWKALTENKLLLMPNTYTPDITAIAYIVCEVDLVTLWVLGHSTSIKLKDSQETD